MDCRKPRWFRCFALALAYHQANGHVLFRRGRKGEPGELALLLSRYDANTGEVLAVPDAKEVRKEIAKAVNHGMLAAGSVPECLIVPAHMVSRGLGSTSRRCPVHSGG